MYITAFLYSAYKINKHNLQDEICGAFNLYINSQNRNSLNVQWGVYSRCHNVTVIAVNTICYNMLKSYLATDHTCGDL